MNRRGLIAVVVVVVVVGVGSVLWPRQDPAGKLSATQQARVTRFARQQAAKLGDLSLKQVTLFLGPQTPQATGGPRLTKSEALIILRGRFKCHPCHDPWLADHDDRSWKGSGVEYVVAWPSLGVIAYTSSSGPDPLNLHFATGIKQALTITI